MSTDLKYVLKVSIQVLLYVTFILSTIFTYINLGGWWMVYHLLALTFSCLFAWFWWSEITRIRHSKKRNYLVKSWELRNPVFVVLLALSLGSVLGISIQVLRPSVNAIHTSIVENSCEVNLERGVVLRFDSNMIGIRPIMDHLSHDHKNRGGERPYQWYRAYTRFGDNLFSTDVSSEHYEHLSNFVQPGMMVVYSVIECRGEDKVRGGFRPLPAELLQMPELTTNN